MSSGAHAQPHAHQGTHEDAPHGASQQQIHDTIARLARDVPSHIITLDALTLALKAAGFQRPPGSPRLVTRLRQLPGVEVLPNARVRMMGDDVGATAAREHAGRDEHAPAPSGAIDADEAAREKPRQQSGGRRRRAAGGGKAGAASAAGRAESPVKATTPAAEAVAPAPKPARGARRGGQGRRGAKKTAGGATAPAAEEA